MYIFKPVFDDAAQYVTIFRLRSALAVILMAFYLARRHGLGKGGVSSQAAQQSSKSPETK